MYALTPTGSILFLIPIIQSAFVQGLDLSVSSKIQTFKQQIQSCKQHLSKNTQKVLF